MLQLDLIDEFRLSAGERAQIGELLCARFPEAGFSRTRLHAKQLPPRRLLAIDDGQIIGHLGLVHRVVGTESGPMEIFGVMDVCVPTRRQGQGIASRMLARVELLARENNIRFLMLFADDPRLYEQNGYRRADNSLRWLKIHEHEIIGIGESVVRELMIKPLTTQPWPDGVVDLLGHIF